MGFDADLVLIDPNARYVVRAEDLYYKNKFSAYEGREIGCRIVRTVVRGKTVFEATQGIVGAPEGRRIDLA